MTQAKALIGKRASWGMGFTGGLHPKPKDDRRGADGRFLSKPKKNEDKRKKFAEAWNAHGGADAPKLTKEYVFAADIQYRDKRGAKRKRGWKFDYAIPDLMVAIEVDGNAWQTKGGGRHGQDSDRVKMNEAAARGWMVFRFSPAQLDKKNAKESVRCVLRGVARRMGGGE
jgi:very-short-patch-repair endonuclease